MTEISKDALVAAVVALAEAGIPTDTQELLLQGDPMRGIKPSALQSAIMSALSTPPQPEAQGEPVAWWWTGPKGGFLADNKKPSWPCEPLYAHPHPRKGDADGK
ncbi:hypothetical protein [Rhizobium leguminosarum]